MTQMKGASITCDEAVVEREISLLVGDKLIYSHQARFRRKLREDIKS